MRLEKAYMEKLIYRDAAGKMVNHVNDLILKMVEEHKNKVNTIFSSSNFLFNVLLLNCILSKFILGVNNV